MSRLNKKPENRRLCAHCGGEYYTQAKHYCSKACWYAAKPPASIKKLKCKFCGDVFLTKAHLVGKRRYCSKSCATSAQYSDIPRFTKKCDQCGTPYYRRASLSGKYCSQACAHLGRSNRSNIYVKCLHCNTEFTTRQYKIDRGEGKYCSHDCYSKSKVKLSTEHHGQRSQHIRWKNSVLARNGTTCVKCGAHKDLCCHHILPWISFPAFRLDPNNGVVVCSSCHVLIHKLIGKDGVFRGISKAMMRRIAREPLADSRKRLNRTVRKAHV